MANSTLYCIFSDLVAAMKTVVEGKYVFLKDRPNVTDDAPMSKFVVIDLPLTIRDYVIGSRRTMLETDGILYAFVQSRSNATLDVNATGDFVDSIVSLFPISGTYCVATNPRVRLMGGDGQGFQVTTITFDLRSRWGVFNNDND